MSIYNSTEFYGGCRTEQCNWQLQRNSRARIERRKSPTDYEPLREGVASREVRIDDAARAARRSPNTVKLLAVSKTFGPEAVRSVYATGQRAFGENYLQEAQIKREALADLPDIEWHLIGPLQSNKARAAAETFDWVETVDRLKAPCACPPRGRWRGVPSWCWCR